MLSTVDNSKGKNIAIPKYDHDRLWNTFADKACNIGKLRTGVGIPGKSRCDELYECLRASSIVPLSKSNCCPATCLISSSLICKIW